MTEYLITLGDGLYYGVTAIASVVGRRFWDLIILAVEPCFLIAFMGVGEPHHLYQDIAQMVYFPAQLLTALAGFACCQRKGYAGDGAALPLFMSQFLSCSVA